MSFSIIIPSTGKRTDVLYETIGAALKAIENLEAEIVLVTNPDKLLPFADTRLRVIHVDFNNVSASRNLGARTAQYETLFFIDDDILIHEHNLRRVEQVLGSLKHPFLLNAVWGHSKKVQELKESTLLGKLASKFAAPNWVHYGGTDVAIMTDWQAESLIESSPRDVFSEACFVMNRAFFLESGGFDENFYFGGEGVAYMSELVRHGIHYYVDLLNVVGHNEWDKYLNWDILEARAANTATLVNNKMDRVSFMGSKYNNLTRKLLYGSLLYGVLPIMKQVIRRLPADGAGLHLAQKLYNQQQKAIFWRNLSMEAALRPPDQIGQ